MELRSNQTSSPETGKSRLGYKILGFLGRRAISANTSRPAEAYSGGPGSVRLLHSSMPALAKGNKVLLSRPVVEHDKDSIMGVVLAGDTAVAITRRSQPSSRLPLIRLVELPHGEHASSNLRTGKLLAEVDSSKLNAPRGDGIVQSWETFELGRSEKVIKIGDAEDMSLEHYGVTVNSDGTVSVEDTSTNGTVVITDTTIARGVENPQLMALYDRLSDSAKSCEWATPMSQHASVIIA